MKPSWNIPPGNIVERVMTRELTPEFFLTFALRVNDSRNVKVVGCLSRSQLLPAYCGQVVRLSTGLLFIELNRGHHQSGIAVCFGQSVVTPHHFALGT